MTAEILVAVLLVLVPGWLFALALVRSAGRYSDLDAEWQRMQAERENEDPNAGS